MGAFGPEAVDWGFILVALIPHEQVDRAKFKLKFSEGLTLEDPSKRFSDPGDVQFQAITDRFRSEVADRKGSMLEVGSRARSGTSYRSWFPPDIEHLGIDITHGPNVDVVCDAHHLSRHVDQTFDFAFSMAVFEHLLMPWKVAIEMNKVLNEGALGLIISHAAWPLHEEPWDFFRFSKESWRGIFNKHTGFEVVDAQYRYPASIVPDYINDPNFQAMSLGPTYLLSGCLVRRTGTALVEWNAEASDVYDLSYSHAKSRRRCHRAIASRPAFWRVRPLRPVLPRPGPGGHPPRLFSCDSFAVLLGSGVTDGFVAMPMYSGPIRGVVASVSSSNVGSPKIFGGEIWHEAAHQWHFSRPSYPCVLYEAMFGIIHVDYGN